MRNWWMSNLFGERREQIQNLKVVFGADHSKQTITVRNQAAKREKPNDFNDERAALEQ